MENNIKEMSMPQLVELKQSIDKEIALRKQKEKEEGEKEIFKLLKVIQNLCAEYDINLYDEHDNLIYFDKITT